jgi:hypothetical protein
MSAFAMRSSRILALTMLSLGGCYLSHGEVTADAGVDAPSAPAACTFSYLDRTLSREISCTLPASSVDGCTEAARCICTRWHAADPEEIEPCIEFELVPRGAITFADYCTESPPARMTMAEALEGYLDFHGEDLRIGEGCRAMPALASPR